MELRDLAKRRFQHNRKPRFGLYVFHQRDCFSICEQLSVRRTEICEALYDFKQPNFSGRPVLAAIENSKVVRSFPAIEIEPM